MIDVAGWPVEDWGIEMGWAGLPVCLGFVVMLIVSSAPVQVSRCVKTKSSFMRFPHAGHATRPSFRAGGSGCDCGCEVAGYERGAEDMGGDGVYSASGSSESKT